MKELLRRLPGADFLREVRERSYLYKGSRRNPNGFRFVGNAQMREGSFEEDVVHLVKLLAKEGRYKTFIDIGAHHGYFSCLSHALGIPVLAFEPNPLNISILKRNFKINQIDRARVLNLALGDANREIEMFGFGTGFSIHKNWALDVSRKSYQVSMQTLDSLDLDLSDCIIKIDVEGAEGKLLEGAYRSLKQCKNTFLIMEVSDILARTSNSSTGQHNGGDTVKLLIKLGFAPLVHNNEEGLIEVSKESLVKYIEELSISDSANLFFRKHS